MEPNRNWVSSINFYYSFKKPLNIKFGVCAVCYSVLLYTKLHYSIEYYYYFSYSILCYTMCYIILYYTTLCYFIVYYILYYIKINYSILTILFYTICYNITFLLYLFSLLHYSKLPKSNSTYKFITCSLCPVSL